jgi:hypothetical protein
MGPYTGSEGVEDLNNSPFHPVEERGEEWDQNAAARFLITSRKSPKATRDFDRILN